MAGLFVKIPALCLYFPLNGSVSLQVRSCLQQNSHIKHAHARCLLKVTRGLRKHSRNERAPLQAPKDNSLG